MRLPWISREAYDAISSARTDLQLMLDRERNRFDRLLDQFTKLRLQGATIPEPTATRERKEIDPLTQAVLDASRGKPPAIKNAMLKQLNEDRKAVAAGLMTDADLFRRIENGFTPDDQGIPE